MDEVPADHIVFADKDGEAEASFVWVVIPNTLHLGKPCAIDLQNRHRFAYCCDV